MLEIALLKPIIVP